MGLLSWIFEPLGENVGIQESEVNITIPTKINIEPKLPISIPHKIYRPTTFNEYIGQKKAKSILQRYIEEVKNRNLVMPHILLYAPPGTGKTTLARIIAKELNVNFTECITAELTNYIKLLNLIKQVDGGVLFLDEIHNINKKMAELTYTLIEDFKWRDNYIKPFTLIGATTELGDMIKRMKPFVDRFKLIIELEPYRVDEIKRIIKQYKNKIFPDDNLSDEIYTEIAINSRLTPRLAIRLLEATIFFKGDLKSVLVNFNIIKDGFTTRDLQVLQLLYKNPKGIGLQALASYINVTPNDYLYNIEPYLLQKGVINRTPRGRKITEDGIEILKQLKFTYDKMNK